MSIPTSIWLDIGGKEVLKFEAMLDLLWADVVEEVVENDNLFTGFPIGATMQDGGKRKRSGVLT